MILILNVYIIVENTAGGFGVAGCEAAGFGVAGLLASEEVGTGILLMNPDPPAGEDVWEEEEGNWKPAAPNLNPPDPAGAPPNRPPDCNRPHTIPGLI